MITKWVWGWKAASVTSSSTLVLGKYIQFICPRLGISDESTVKKQIQENVSKIKLVVVNCEARWPTRRRVRRIALYCIFWLLQSMFHPLQSVCCWKSSISSLINIFFWAASFRSIADIINYPPGLVCLRAEQQNTKWSESVTKWLERRFKINILVFQNVIVFFSSLRILCRTYSCISQNTSREVFVFSSRQDRH